MSVPMWGTTLSGPLPVDALVGRYPTNQLMGRRPLTQRPCELSPSPSRASVACGISPAFAELFPTEWQVTYVLLTHSPLG